ncbi:MAG TPA: hypothetical protein VET87_11840, partial [Rubrivivax sp.]|nr:hypothetical protein [Rubrivivax sp.]
MSSPPRAVPQVEIEHALEQLGPAQSHRAVVRTVRVALSGPCSLSGRLGRLRHHQRAPLGVGCQHTMEADQVQPRP